MSAGEALFQDWFSGGRFPVLLKIVWRMGLREPYGMIMGLIFPVFLLILFGGIGEASGSHVAGLTLIQIYLPTIIVIGFVSTGIMAVPYMIVRDREIGWLRRISTTPLSASKMIAAHVIINLVYSLAGTVVVIIGGMLFFNAVLNVGIFYFVISIILSLAVVLSLGFVVAALAPTQRFASGLGGALFYPLLFLSGLWVQPAAVGEPLRSIMWYSPVGAADRCLLYSIFNTAPPAMEIVALFIYTAIFTFIAIRFFRWT